jgi:hypothetical protein
LNSRFEYVYRAPYHGEWLYDSVAGLIQQHIKPAIEKQSSDIKDQLKKQKKSNLISDFFIKEMKQKFPYMNIIKTS